MPLQRAFLGWQGPLVDGAVRLIEERLQGHEAAADLLVVVPTAQASRRLRLALARSGISAAGLRVTTPTGLMPPRADQADQAMCIRTWIETLDGAPGWVSRLVGGRRSDPRVAEGVAVRLAQQVDDLRRVLAESGLDYARVAQHPAVAADRERWEALAALEERYLTLLARSGLVDPRQAQIDLIRGEGPPPPARGILVIGVPDPVPIAADLLRRWSEAVTVVVAVAAPEEFASTFDDMGRPLVEAWQTEEIPLPLEMIEAAPTAHRQVERAVEVIRRLAAPLEDVAIGLVDGELTMLIEGELDRAGLAFFNPAGRPLAGHRLGRLCMALLDLALAPRIEHLGVLVEHPDVRAYLRPRGVEVDRAVAELDGLRRRSLARDMEALGALVQQGEMSALAGLLDHIGGLGARLRGEVSPAEGLRRCLAEIYEDRSVESLGGEEGFAAPAARLATLLEACVRADDRPERLPIGVWRHMWQGLVGSQRVESVRPPRALDVEGWLELLFNDAPYLILLGVNDHVLPAAVSESPLLPEPLRRALGLRHQGTRAARDAYLLRALWEQRRTTGALAVFYGTRSLDGEPLRPSRLLLRRPDVELVEAVEKLYGPPPVDRPAPARTHAWRLQFPTPSPPERLRVSDFRSYLRCPLRHYLERVLGMEPVEFGPPEMDRPTFGTLIHDALQALAETESTDPRELEERLLQRLRALMVRRFGRTPSAALALQREAAEQRLRHAARVEAEQRRAGWSIVACELPLMTTIAGIDVTGIADRIDRHTDGRWRVVDYKTRDRPQTPRDAHLASLSRAGRPYERYETGGKAWIDLQMPLYRIMVARHLEVPVERIELAYFSLPAAVRQTAVDTWEGYGSAQEESALECARGIVDDMRRGCYWPPKDPFSLNALDRIVLLDDGAALVEPPGMVVE